jgi:hypothetical protein
VFSLVGRVLVAAVDLLARRILEKYRGTIRDCGHQI